MIERMGRIVTASLQGFLKESVHEMEGLAALVVGDLGALGSAHNRIAVGAPMQDLQAAVALYCIVRSCERIPCV